MSESQGDSVTQLLLAWSDGDERARDELVPIVYEELKGLAKRYLRFEPGQQSLRCTGLVHEAYLRLVDQDRVRWQNRAHFLGIAARMMRRILVDRARAKRAAKRGGGQPEVTLDDEILAAPSRGVELGRLDRALNALAVLDERQAKIVELRFFGGLTVEETAQVVGISAATVKREWSMARAWLRREIYDGA